MKRQLVRNLALASVLASVVVGAGATAVMADTEMGHLGTVGAHSLRDSLATPGAICVFGDNGQNVFPLERIRVRPPRVKAIDKTAGVDRQRVGWRFLIQRSVVTAGGVHPTGTVSWQTIYRSPIQKDRTSDTQNASFTMMSRAFTNQNPDPDQFRVLVKAFWYRADGSKQGAATHLVDFYQDRGDAVETRDSQFCASTY